MYITIGFTIGTIYMMYVIGLWTINIYNYLKWYCSGVDTDYDGSTGTDSNLLRAHTSVNMDPLFLAFMAFFQTMIALIIIFTWPVTGTIALLIIIPTIIRKRNISKRKMWGL